MSVVVSGAKLYNNKGKVVEQWEPYFSLDFALTDPALQMGESAPASTTMPLVARNGPSTPMARHRLVIYGEPLALEAIAPARRSEARPSPWTRYTYDAADLASLTHPEDGTVPEEHRWTPKSEVVDALNHVRC